MPLLSRVNPGLDGAAAPVGTARTRSVRIPAGAYPTPFWIRTEAGLVMRVDSLPWQGAFPVGEIEVLSADPSAPAGGAISWPNDPGGLPDLADSDMTKAPASDGEWGYTQRDSSWSLEAGSSTPSGDSNIVRVNYPDGFADGDDPGVYAVGAGGAVELFYGYILQLTPGYQLGPQKIGAFPFELPEGNGTNLFALLRDSGSGFQLHANWSLAPADNRLYPNGSTIITFAAATWYRIEWHIRLPNGGSNGLIRAWVSVWNGSSWSTPQIQLDYTGLSWGSVTSFSEAQLDFTWGGGAGTKTQDDGIDIDHARVAGA